MTRTISLKDLQSHFNLARDEEIIIENAGQPLAHITPPGTSGASATPELGFWAGQITTSPDFDIPLPDSFWLGEE
jgi:antitoxin (DNA-binding transcriptional repressor) of toxin-antitoxin stability system